MSSIHFSSRALLFDIFAPETNGMRMSTTECVRARNAADIINSPLLTVSQVYWHLVSVNPLLREVLISNSFSESTSLQRHIPHWSPECIPINSGRTSLSFSSDNCPLLSSLTSAFHQPRACSFLFLFSIRFVTDTTKTTQVCRSALGNRIPGSPSSTCYCRRFKWISFSRQTRDVPPRNQSIRVLWCRRVHPGGATGVRAGVQALRQRWQQYDEHQGARCRNADPRTESDWGGATEHGQRIRRGRQRKDRLRRVL